MCAVAAAVAMAAVLAACGASGPSTSGGSGSGGTLRVVMPSVAGDDLDPGLMKSTDQSLYYPIMFDALVFFSPEDGSIQPALAEKYARNDDGSMDFTLRDANFSDGQPVTSDDVKFSLMRYIGRDASKLVPAGGLRLGGYIKDIVVKDDKNFTITTNGQAPGLLGDLSPNGGIAPYILPKHVLDKVGAEAFNKKPVGSGPFKLASQAAGRSMSFEANTKYWGGKPGSSKLELQFVADTNTRLSMLNSGEADIVGGIYGPAIKQAQGLDSVKIVTNPKTFLSFLSLQGKQNPKSPFSKPEVRTAINMSIDRKAIVDNLMFGKGAPTSLMLFPDSLGYPSNADDMTFEFNPDEAKAMLAKAGYPDGFKFDMLVSQDAKDLGQALSQQLSKVGVTANMQVVDQAETLGQLADPAGFDTTRASMIFGYSGIAYRYDYAGALASHLIPETTAVTQPTGNKEFEALYAAQAEEGDETKRAEMVTDWFTQIHDESYVIPLWYGDANFAVRSKVTGWKPIPGASVPFNLQSANIG
jgi:peptide/nickel transport system substrate-binding protein